MREGFEWLPLELRWQMLEQEVEEAFVHADDQITRAFTDAPFVRPDKYQAEEH